MTSFTIKVNILFLVLVFFLGCGVYKKETMKVHSSIIKSPKYENNYYYFVKYQLLKKKGDIDGAISNLHKAIESDPKSLHLKKELALIYVSQKDIESGLKVIEQILKEDPENVEALIFKGSIKQQQESYQEAKDTFEKVLTIDPKQENIYHQLGGIYIEEKDIEKALTLYNKMVQNIPDSYVGHFFLGKTLAQKGNFSDAEKAFEKAFDLKPDLIEPRFELLEIYKNRKDPVDSKIIDTYKEILRQAPQNIRATMELGYYYHKIGMKRKAEDAFKGLGARSLNDKNIVRKIVQLFINKKQYDEAITILEGMLKGAPGSSDIHFIMGLTYYDKKTDNDNAIKHFSNVKPSSMFYENAAVHLSFLYQQQGENEKAINSLKNLVASKPDNVEFIIYLGSIYEEIGEFENAETMFNKGIDIAPKNIKLHYRLGVVYDKWGKKDESIEKMKAVIKLDPKDARALNYLGYTMVEMGQDLNEAERLIKEALKYKPDDGYITDSLGWVYYKKNLLKQAIDVLKRAVSLVPDDPIILEHLGDAYMKTDDKKNALEFYERSLNHHKEGKTELENKIKKLKEITD
jgi:tetratricopeptide (TPR) repeat protein